MKTILLKTANGQQKRCSNCIIPQSTKGIKFDENCCCEICYGNQFVETTRNKAGELSYHIDEIKRIGRRRNYDCLVGLSGGRDSSYLLYLLVKKHNLRCMAAYHRTPFTPDIIDTNVRKLTKKLNVPLIEMDICKIEHKKFARKMTHLWISRPDKIIANLACTPCKQHNHEVYKIARNKNIGAIVFGGNKYEEFQIGSAHSKRGKIGKSKESGFWKKYHKIYTIASRGLLVLIRWPALIVDFPMLFKSSILHLSNRTPYLRIRYADIKMVDYYNIAGYDEKAVIKFLSDVGWELPGNCNTTWRADCSFSEIKNYMFRKNEGMSYVDAYLSNMIRAGVLTRAEALKRVNIEGVISQERIEEVCSILDIPVSLLKKT